MDMETTIEPDERRTAFGRRPSRVPVERDKDGTWHIRSFAAARKLLRSTDEPIEHIVYLTGFSEPSTFYRAFKRWSGMTPVQYREQKKAAAAAGKDGKAAADTLSAIVGVTRK